MIEKKNFDIVILYRITSRHLERPIIEEVKTLKVGDYHFDGFNIRNCDGPAEQRSNEVELRSISLERPYQGIMGYYTDPKSAEIKLKKEIQAFEDHAKNEIERLTKAISK